MATAAQIEANRKNARTSTGPVTEAGKGRASQNAIKLGLFSSRNFVLPADQAEHDELHKALWEGLRPHGTIEGVYAIEAIRATWRLHRCATIESNLAASVRDTDRVLDAMQYSDTAPTQAAVDRARTQTLGVLNRSMAELRRLQTERRLRTETLPAHIEPDSLGVSNSKQLSGGISAFVEARLDLGKAAEIESLNAKIAYIYGGPFPPAYTMDSFMPKNARTKGTQTAGVNRAATAAA